MADENWKQGRIETWPVEVNALPNLELTTRSVKQIALQMDLGDSIKSEYLPNAENIDQHIPVTYLTANNLNLTPGRSETLVEPVTYILSRNIASDGGGEAQKIILVQEIVSNSYESLYSPEEREIYAIKESQTGETEFLRAWNMESRDVKIEEIPSKSKIVGKHKEKLTRKSERKISRSKKLPLNKKNSKLKPQKKHLNRVEEEKDERQEKEGKHLFELTKLEDSVEQVAERLKIGCECSDTNCFDGLNPDDVFKHRLNIADLTKEEHDMYLMGVIMASIHNLEETYKHKERTRIRSCYAYQGKKICLTAFLYLQHVTMYQMKRLRSHLKNHGVSPRIHGNRGRKPANTFSLDIYRRTTNFIQNYIEEHSVKTVANFTTFHDPTKTIGKKEKVKIANKMTSYHLPPECTKRIVHVEYKNFFERQKPSQKVMKYSTFTSFLKKQFPNVKFQKREEKKQEKLVVRLEETEKCKAKEKIEDPDSGVDKSVQVEKSLVNVPGETEIIVNDHQLELYEESRGLQPDFGFGSQVLMGVHSYDLSQTLNSEQYYAIGSTL